MKFDLLSSASLIALGGALAVVSAPGTANATLSCFTGYCTETVSPGATTTDFNGLSLTLDQFNPGVGQTLKSVVISENGSYSSSGTITNTTTGTSFSFKLGMTLSLTGGAGAPGNFPSLSISSGGVFKSFPSVPLNSTVGYSYAKTLTPSTSTLTTGLAGFLGSGTFDVLFSSATSTTTQGGGGNANSVLSTFATPSVTITYNFTTSTPTPEPASLAVFGAALAGLGVVRRRRKG